MLVLVLSVASSAAVDMYCGDRNCYEVLGVEADAGTRDIKRAYRKLSMEHHPDRATAAGGDVEAATAKFAQLAEAHEVLSDADRRESYDFYLAHPEQQMYNQMRYYQAKYQPKTDPRAVLLAALVLASALQFMVLRDTYRRRAAQHPEVQSRLQALRAKKDRPRRKASQLKSSSSSSVEAAEEEEEKRALLMVLAELETEGLLEPPRPLDTLIFSLIFAPVRLPRWWSQRAAQRREEAAAAAAAVEREREAVAEIEAARRLKDQQRKSRQAAHREAEEAAEAARRAKAAEEAARVREEEAQRESDKMRRAKLGERAAARLAACSDAGTLQDGPALLPALLADIDLVRGSAFASTEQLQGVVAALEAASDAESVGAALVTLRRLARRSKERRLEQLDRLGGGSGGAEGGSEEPWSDKELSLLSKALNKYPGGARNRWAMVAQYMNGGSSVHRSAQAYAAKATEIKLQSQQQQQQPAAAAPSAPLPEQKGRAAAEERPWSAQEQRLLEEGMQRFGKLPDPKERWRSIASEIPGRSAKACALRFKAVRADLLLRAKDQAKSGEGAGGSGGGGGGD